MSTIDFQCPGCSRWFSVPIQQAGRKAGCRHCRIFFLIPANGVPAAAATAATLPSSALPEHEPPSEPESELFRIEDRPAPAEPRMSAARGNPRSNTVDKAAGFRAICGEYWWVLLVVATLFLGARNPPPPPESSAEPLYRVYRFDPQTNRVRLLTAEEAERERATWEPSGNGFDVKPPEGSAGFEPRPATDRAPTPGEHR